MAKITGLEKLENDFNALAGNLAGAQDEFAELLVDDIKSRTVRRSGVLQDAWKAKDAFLDGSMRVLMIDTTQDSRVVYSDVYERGRKDGANYEGRFPVKGALDAGDAALESLIDRAMDKTFGGF